MDSEDEHCDLKTLEALLDEDDGDGQQSVTEENNEPTTGIDANLSLNDISFDTMAENIPLTELGPSQKEPSKVNDQELDSPLAMPHRSISDNTRCANVPLIATPKTRLSPEDFVVDGSPRDTENVTQGPNAKRKMEEPDISAKSVQEFLNTASDSESDCGKDTEIDQAELDTLATLVADDPDFEIAPSDHPATETENPGSKSRMMELSASESPSAVSHHARSFWELKNSRQISSKQEAGSSRDMEKSNARNGKHTPVRRQTHTQITSSDEKKKRSETISRKEEQRKSSVSPKRNDPATQISPQTLQEEMAKMQKKMLELQRLLEQQQQQNSSSSSPSSASSPKRKRKQTSGGKMPHPSKTSAATDKKTPVQNQVRSAAQRVQSYQRAQERNQQSSSGNERARSLKLMADDDDSLFTKGQKMSKVTNSTQKQVKMAPLSSSVKKTLSRAKMERDLFGDSDSDWDELDGEEKKTLSEAGNDLQRLLHSSQRKREAHRSEFNIRDSGVGTSRSWSRPLQEPDADCSRKSNSDQNKAEKNVLQCKSSSTDQAKMSTATSETEKFVTEDFSKIRIINPLVSSSLMKMRMEGRKLINVSRIHLKLKTPDLQGDWVTIAVVVGKTDSKSSSTGKPYCIWKLNDLEDLDNSVSFFLFGEVHKQLWKTDIGTVIGVLNPSIMDSMERNKSEPAFTVKNPSQVMIMGRSKDLGWCTAMTKKGNKCHKFINKKLGECCAYHVQAAYRKMSATRLELHGSVTGVKPKSFEQKIFAKDCAYMYAGQTYVPHSSNSKSKKGVTLKKLQQAAGRGRLNKVNTLSLQDVKPTATSTAGNRPGRVGDDPNDVFMDMITVPTPGSMNFVAFLKNKDKVKAESSPRNGKSPAMVQSITAKDLIKHHQQLMQERKAERQKASQLLLSDMSSASGTSPTPSVDPLSQAPVLGKGFYKGQDISLDISDYMPRTSADRKKLKALSVIKERGGLQKEDPNAVKKTDTKVTERVKRRVETDCDVQSPKATLASPQSSALTKEPPAKRSKLLGNVDLNSDEVKNILKARSKHKGALAQAEAEREEVYFTELEKKEMLEEKMNSVTSIEITVITCRQCRYTAQSAKDSCKQEGHTLSRSKAKKRFFMCKKCKHRTYVIGGKFPTEACRNCGAQAYEKTSMYKERAGPKLESEVLNIRGDEMKFLNSLDHKVFLNTVVND